MQGGKSVFRGGSVSTGFPKFNSYRGSSTSGATAFNRHSSTSNYNTHSVHVPILRYDNQNNGDGSYQFQ